MREEDFPSLVTPVADEGEFTSVLFATSFTLFMSADFRPKDVTRCFTRDPLIPDRGLNSISPSRYVIDWGVCPTVLLTKISARGTLPYALTCRCNTLAGSRPIVDFIKALYVNNTTKFRCNSLPLSNSTIHLASTYLSYGKARKEEEACPRSATCVPRGEGTRPMAGRHQGEVLVHAHLSPHRLTPRKYFLYFGPHNSG